MTVGGRCQAPSATRSRTVMNRECSTPEWFGSGNRARSLDCVGHNHRRLGMFSAGQHSNGKSLFWPLRSSASGVSKFVREFAVHLYVVEPAEASLNFL